MNIFMSLDCLILYQKIITKIKKNIKDKINGKLNFSNKYSITKFYNFFIQITKV
jgi:hypothetical protein